MELNTQEQLKAHLLATNEEFRSLAAKHETYDQQLHQLETKCHLSANDQLEEVKLKKMKLHVKDQMLALMNRYRAEHVS
jgi:uncharacterized protein YdcH (DUF465 family)